MRNYKSPVFQHRHYAEIAALLSQSKDLNSDYLTDLGREHLLNEFAGMFARDNGKFNRERFLAAANGSPSNGRDKR
jgi:hypothetical protein